MLYITQTPTFMAYEPRLLSHMADLIGMGVVFDVLNGRNHIHDKGTCKIMKCPTLGANRK